MLCFHTVRQCCLPLYSKWLNLVLYGSEAVCCWCYGGLPTLQPPIAVGVVEWIVTTGLFLVSFLSSFSFWAASFLVRETIFLSTVVATETLFKLLKKMYFLPKICFWSQGCIVTEYPSLSGLVLSLSSLILVSHPLIFYNHLSCILDYQGSGIPAVLGFWLITGPTLREQFRAIKSCSCQPSLVLCEEAGVPGKKTLTQIKKELGLHTERPCTAGWTNLRASYWQWQWQHKIQRSIFLLPNYSFPQRILEDFRVWGINQSISQPNVICAPFAGYTFILPPRVLRYITTLVPRNWVREKQNKYRYRGKTEGTTEEGSKQTDLQ